MAFAVQHNNSTSPFPNIIRPPFVGSLNIVRFPSLARPGRESDLVNTSVKRQFQAG